MGNSRRSRAKGILLSVLLGIIVLIVVGVLWFLNKSPLSKIPENVSVDLTLSGILLSHGEAGQKLWTLNASKADVELGTNSVTLQGVEIKYNIEQDNSTVVIVSDHGRLFQSNNTAILWPWVVGTYKDMQLTGRHLSYDGQIKKVTLSNEVTFTSDTMEANASTMYMDLDSGDIHAVGNIQAIIYLPDPNADQKEDSSGNGTAAATARPEQNAAAKGLPVGPAAKTAPAGAKPDRALNSTAPQGKTGDPDDGLLADPW